MYTILKLLALITILATGNTEEDWKQNIAKTAMEIKATPADTTYNFDFLKTILKDKRIVLLGENGHQVKEFNLIKFKLIKYLHEELGYTILLSENGLAENRYGMQLRSKISPDSLLKLCFFPVWQTQENLTLADYIQKNPALDLAAFDFQYNDYFKANDYLEVNLGQSFPEIFPLIKLDSIFVLASATETDQDKANRETIRTQLIASYDSLILRVGEKLNLENNKELRIVLKVLENRRCANSYYGKLTYTPFVRDSLMALTLQWLVDTIYPTEKIIVWAANYHLFKSYPKYTSWTTLMGAELSKKFYSESYFIGLYMLAGEVGVGRYTRKVQKPGKDFLESYLKHSPYEAAFFDLRSRDPGMKENGWINEELKTLDNGGKTPVIFRMQQTFDGLIFLKTVSPAERL